MLKRVSLGKVLAVLGMGILLIACAGTTFRRNSVPGLSLNDKSIVVLVQEYSHDAQFTNKLDSVWNANVKTEHLKADFVYREALSLDPIDPEKVWGKCADSYMLFLEVSGTSSTQSTDPYGVPSNSSTIEYTGTMYDCNTKKVVWKMVLSTAGYSTMAKGELVKSIFEDFKQNNIIKE